MLQYVISINLPTANKPVVIGLNWCLSNRLGYTTHTTGVSPSMHKNRLPPSGLKFPVLMLASYVQARL